MVAKVVKVVKVVMVVKVAKVVKVEAYRLPSARDYPINFTQCP